MISTFGPRAQAFAEGLGEMDAVIADMSMLGAAYVEAVRRREIGRPFYGMVLYEEPRALTTLGYAWQVLSQIADLDMRRAALDQLGEGRLQLGTQPAHALWALPEATAGMIGEFLSLANGTLVRSFAEAERLNALCSRARSIEPVLSEPKVPDVRPHLGSRPGVVIWAPQRAAAFVTWYAFALVEFFGDVTCVTAGGDVPAGLPARFVSLGDPSLNDVLAAAQCVLCPEPDDPGAAVAFARAGFGVAAPLASGAHEYVRDIVSFGLNRQRDVEIAVKIAVGRPASLRELPQPLRSPLPPALPLPVDELPLVSILISTYNRPQDLASCLRELARQTYPNLEIVVINDAGENVDHVVASYPLARIVNLPVNGGQERLLIEGFKIVKGAFVQLLADDDTLFPDHVERVMAAMLRSGAFVAHGNTLMRYQQRDAAGNLSIVGYNAKVFNDSATPSEALISTPIAGQSLIIRSETVDAVGGYSDKTLLADQEFQMRLANRYVFAYVDSLTNEWRVRAGGENRSSQTDGGGELRRVYTEFYPLPDRPLVTQQREAALAAMAARPKGFIFEPTVLVEKPARSS